MATTSTMVQMNTRIDRTLKQEGDRVFKEEGFTPSEAIRAFWDYAARTGGKSEVLQTVLKEAPAEEDGITPQLEALRQGRAEICEAMSKLGLGENPVLFEDGLDYGELRDSYLEERLAEKDARSV